MIVTKSASIIEYGIVIKLSLEKVVRRMKPTTKAPEKVTPYLLASFLKRIV